MGAFLPQVTSLSDPRILKFLKSTQAAFPVSRDPWQDLSQGLSATREEIACWIDDLQGNGAIHGIWTEPNVHHPEIHESLDFATHAVEPTRWTAPTHEVILASCWRMRDREMKGWQSTKWFKIGIMIDVGADADHWDPFAPSTDRTMAPEAPREWAIPREYIEISLVPYSRLQGLDPRKPFWEEFGRESTGDSAREVVQQLLIHRLARRFALRLSPTALGWRGCGLACWSLESKDVERAASALAAITCTGDVAIRKSTTEWPFNLSAIILNHAPGSGKKTAAEISRRWGRDLGRWIDFQSLG
jgi:hypothetical protein